MTSFISEIKMMMTKIITTIIIIIIIIILIFIQIDKVLLQFQISSKKDYNSKKEMIKICRKQFYTYKKAHCKSTLYLKFRVL